MSEVPTVYEERRGWTPRAIIGTTLCVPGGIACFVGFAYIHSLKLLILGVVCVLGSINLAGGALSRRLVLRVDENGVLLRGGGRNGSTPQPVPWAEVQSIFLYKPRNITMIGIGKNFAGVPAKPMDLGNGESVATPDMSTPPDSWRIDFERLQLVVGAVAPNVEVTDRR
jgi:hypothetical protein